SQTASNKRPDENHDPKRHNPGEQELREQSGFLASELHACGLQFFHELGIFNPDCAEEKWFATCCGDFRRIRVSGLQEIGGFSGGTVYASRARLGLWQNPALDSLLLYHTFGDLSAFQIVLELTIGDCAVRELRYGALPHPQQQQHNRKVPERRTPFRRLR